MEMTAKARSTTQKRKDKCFDQTSKTMIFFGKTIIIGFLCDVGFVI
jgi:hypothetical protein